MARTAVLWGWALRTAPASIPPTAQRTTPQRLGASEQPDWERVASTRQLVCQTGCVGHTVHWLTAEGTCQLSGQACERLALEKASG
ncbi:hypothetical protein [Hydrogenophaga sp.]|uniref:hypothetical protein n=1 Tax=Hydrogenophaga sp. TaxID=1904254 RepID=UPI003F6C13D4